MILIETFFQDLRYGARSLFRNLRFTTASVFTLALGIGFNTAVFTAYKAIIARPLAAREPERMVNFSLQLRDGPTNALFSYPDYEAYRDRLQAFSGVVAVAIDQLRLTDAGGVVNQRRTETGSLIGGWFLPPAVNNAEFATTFLVSENYFKVLGIAAVRGSTFDYLNSSDLAASPSVLISENYWQRRFAGDPAVLGKSIRLNGAAFTIIGITPHNFAGTGMAVPDFWLPLSLDRLVHHERNLPQDREDRCCRVFGRLATGASLSQGQAEATLLASRLRTIHDPQSELSQEAIVSVTPGSPLPGKMHPGLRLAILLIMTAAGMVLVIACANAASLQLARVTARQQELGIRLSLGASRPRLIRQLLTESALLALLAGFTALPLTWGLLRVAVTEAVEALPVGNGTLVLNVNPDPEVFIYVFAVSVIAGILFGLAPAIASTRSAHLSIIRSAGVSSVRSRLRYLFVALQVAVSLTLMISGGMLIRSAIQALQLDTGYDASRVIDLSLQFPEQSQYSAGYRAAIVRDLRARLAALPGVAAVTSARAPNDNRGERKAAVSVNGDPPSIRNLRAVLYYTWVQPDYFQTLGIPLLLGQSLPSQSGQTNHVVVLSESAARRLWPGDTGRNPIGRSLRLGTAEQFHEKGELLPDGPIWQVIGLARDIRGAALGGSNSEQVYLPLPADRLQDYPILVRTLSDTRSVMRTLGPLISAVDPGLRASISTLQELLRQTSGFLAASISAAIALITGLFGLLLAAMGIYSTVSYLVVLRTREVGIRMALGAQKREILGQMMRESSRPVVSGLLAGMVLAIGASYLLRGVLYGLNLIDPISYAGTSLFFLAIALLATWLPSRRAMRVDPIKALRYE